jgi:hypothetical protein
VFESLEKRGYGAAACPAMLMGGSGGESYGVVLAISAPGYVLGDLTAEEREAARESRAREKDARGRAIYDAAVAGETWEAIADAHGYKSVSGARAAATATRSDTASSRRLETSLVSRSADSSSGTACPEREAVPLLARLTGRSD